MSIYINPYLYVGMLYILLNNLPYMHALSPFVCYLLFARLFATIEQCLDGLAGYITPCISSLINRMILPLIPPHIVVI
ncbi:hypothetical protein ACN38_g7285 [Penicillium nordicum]|uniref:Uncharacterized protein n=1 Tax=Penicillium nordicum TaxID=229535 RepID=A0A0M8P774_9EURO|nr:hypothetical protein ACN38_g7285 [Penicillium nordicum]